MDDTEKNGSLMRASDRACNDANDVRRLQLRQHRHLQGAEKIMGVRIKMGKYFFLRKLVDGDYNQDGDYKQTATQEIN